MIKFLLGLFSGGTIGFLFAALTMAARERDSIHFEGESDGNQEKDEY